MIELKVTANSGQHLLDQLLDVSYMVRACLAGEVCDECPCDEACAEVTEVAVDPTPACPASVAGSVEYEDVDTAAEQPAKEPAKRTRKKKEPAAEPVKETEPVAEPVKEAEPVAEQPEGKLTQTDVREILVKTRDRVGMDKVRIMLSKFGGSLANCPEADWPKVVAAANALEADEVESDIPF